MSENPQRKVGIRRGPFMGYEGRVTGRRGELWLVRITLYGREVEVEVAPEEIEERDDPMAALTRELGALIPQALEAHLLTWWGWFVTSGGYGRERVVGDDNRLHMKRGSFGLVADGPAAIARAPSWCIFDNTAHGHAVADAARLQDRIAAR